MITTTPRQLQNGLLLMGLFPTYLLLGLIKHFVPLSRLAQWAWRPPVGPRSRELERRLAAGVVRLSQLTGLPDRDCLQRSLLLYRVLSRAGADPTLVVGFRHVNDRTVGHAWIKVDGNAVIETDADLSRFSTMLHFGARGKVLRSEPALRGLNEN
jgi:hypothetical protein